MVPWNSQAWNLGVVGWLVKVSFESPGVLPRSVLRVHVERAEGLTLRHHSLELFSEWMASNPVHHVPAIAGAQGDGPVRIHELQMFLHELKALDEIHVQATSPVLIFQRKRGSKSCGAGDVWCDNYVTLFGEDGEIPGPFPPAILPGVRWPTMDGVEHGIFFAGVEVAGLNNPCGIS